MIFSKACEHGIKATLYISQQSMKGKRAMLKEIADEIGSPAAFTAKILQDLSRKKLIRSLKGPRGGFYIEKEDLQHLNLISIVTAIDGDEVFTRCGLGLDRCSETYPCPVHDEYLKLKKGMENMLQTTSLAMAAENIEQKNVHLRVRE